MGKRLSAKERLIVALDHTEMEPALAMARRLKGVVRTVKVGSILFTAVGPRVIEKLRAMGFEIMLDLKFLDIPSTVEFSCRAAVRHGVSLLTLHGSGERMMLESAVAGIRSEARRRKMKRPLVLAVTVLTSVASSSAVKMKKQVLDLAQRAKEAGCDGVVTSAREATLLRERLGDTLKLVCPGIRPAKGRAHDQRRTATPAEAIRMGADYLVVGRPITEADDPRDAARKFLLEMEAGCSC